jgi:hypothetical protein
MRKALLGLGIAIAMGTAVPALAGVPSYCTVNHIHDNISGRHAVILVPQMVAQSRNAHLDLLACFPRLKEDTFYAVGALTAQQVIDGVTVFANGMGQFRVLVKGTDYPENSRLPRVDYKFLGLASVTQDNGFATRIPLFQKK